VGTTEAAEDRLERFARTLERTPLGEVRMLGAVPLDPDAHRAAREAAVDAAAAGGRATLASQAMTRMGAWAARTMQPSRYMVTLDGVPWQRESLDPRDQPQVAESLRDAVLALAVMDLVDEGVFDELIGPCRNLAGLGGPEA
jgi:hypothetical protein